MSDKKVNVAIIGPGFGAEFIPIYPKYPDAEMYAICQRTRSKLDEVGDAFAVERRYTSYEELLADDNVDAVHINTPIPVHAEQSVAGLKAGKHVACTVPAATTVEELHAIVAAQRASWNTLIEKKGSPFAIETCHIKLRDSDLSAEITRSRFNTAREYVESFDVYGSKVSFEWQQIEAEKPAIFVGEEARRVEVPDYAHLLPGPIRGFTTKGVYDAGEHAHLSFIQGSGHGGSHPHLAHEFLRSIVEDRDPFPNAEESCNWSASASWLTSRR